MLSSEFQSPSIKIEDINIISNNQAWALTSEYPRSSIKIEDFKINTYNPFNPISTKGGSENVKPITSNVL